MIQKIKKDELVKKIVEACYPDYRGRKFYISTDVPRNLDSYWCEGSRNYYVFYQPSTGKTLDVHTNHPAFEREQPRSLNHLPEGLLLVKRCICSGKDLGITIYVNEGFLGLLPGNGKGLPDSNNGLLEA